MKPWAKVYRRGAMLSLGAAGPRSLVGLTHDWNS